MTKPSLVLALSGLGLLASAWFGSGCGSSSHASAGGRGSGPVNVLYAASLVDLMEHHVGPAFEQTTGYAFAGFAGDSGSLANEVKGRTVRGDVFVSAAASKDALLEGPANGNWVSWYATFASSPLVIGYNRNSAFAADLRNEPWYEVVAKPGFRLGRTDPTTDPKGKLTVEALQAAARAYDQPALDRVASSDSNVFTEASLVGRLQAGQLDAGFFYGVEATVAGLPTVPVTVEGRSWSTSYTITVLANAPHPAGADAFVEYLLGPAGRSLMASEGLAPKSPPVLSGEAPPSLRAVLASGGNSPAG
jgi:molybdate/tungstate transport system substrate-binding protein